MKHTFTKNEWALISLALQQVAISPAEKRHYIIGGKMVERADENAGGIEFREIKNHD